MKAKIVILLCSVLLVGCSGSQAGPAAPLDCPGAFETKGDRILGMDILNSTETGTFEEDFEKAREFGIEFTGLHLLWNQLEATPESYFDPGDTLSLLGDFCKTNNIKISLTIRPIDLTGKTVPSDLEDVRFNTELMKNRFTKLLDFIFIKMDPSLLTSLQVGNEIDHYDASGEHPDFWSDYGSFLFHIRDYLSSKYPGTKLGFTVTLLGSINDINGTSGVFEALSQVVDLVGVTYYPINNDFTVMNTAVVEQHLDAIVDKFKNKIIYMQEVGYQTSAVCNSSESKQAQFICNFFHSWDKHSDVIKLVEFVRLNDVSTTLAEDMADPYGISDERFIEYLRTLGVISHDGKGNYKQGFLTLKQHANIRGWIKN